LRRLPDQGCGTKQRQRSRSGAKSPEIIPKGVPRPFIGRDGLISCLPKEFLDHAIAGSELGCTACPSRGRRVSWIGLFPLLKRLFEHSLGPSSLKTQSPAQNTLARQASSRILEAAVRESLSESNRHRVWQEDCFRVSPAADALVGSQGEDACRRSSLPPSVSEVSAQRRQETR
jgi:hypothetical protein